MRVVDASIVHSKDVFLYFLAVVLGKERERSQKVPPPSLAKEEEEKSYSATTKAMMIIILIKEERERRRTRGGRLRRVYFSFRYY